MDELQEAHHELDRLQGIITRHEGFIFTIRGWLLTVIGGLLAAYYTQNIELDPVYVRIALPVVAVLFVIVEWRHVNLVESVVERVGDIEKLIADSRRPGRQGDGRWYDGPQVNDVCLEGVRPRFPKYRMTFILNLPFYLTVAVIIGLLAWALPEKGKPAQQQGSAAQQGKP
jgi:hypothetical protein